MALNEQQQPGDKQVVTLAAITPGSPVAVGAFNGVAPVGSVTIDGVANQCVIDLSKKVWNLSVVGKTNGAANSAVAVGDAIYISGSAPSFVLNKDTTGVFFGIAAGTVTSGATATIPVRHGSI